MPTCAVPGWRYLFRDAGTGLATLQGSALRSASLSACSPSNLRAERDAAGNLNGFAWGGATAGVSPLG